MICCSAKEAMCEIQKNMALKGIQQKELAILTGKSQQSISQIFQVSNPKLSTLFVICEALNLSIDISPFTHGGE